MGGLYGNVDAFHKNGLSVTILWLEAYSWSQMKDVDYRTFLGKFQSPVNIYLEITDHTILKKKEKKKKTLFFNDFSSLK